MAITPLHCKLWWITHKLSKARRVLHIDKIHKNDNSSLIIPTLSSKSYFIVHFRIRWKENSSEIHAHGIYRSVKLFLQPIKLREISIMMRSWNYDRICSGNLKPTNNNKRAASWQNQQNNLCALSDQSSLCAQWVAEDPMFLHADSEDFDQTGRMPRLIWVFAARTCHLVGFMMRRLKGVNYGTPQRFLYCFFNWHRSHAMRKPVLCDMRKTKSHLAKLAKSNISRLASLCSWAGRFESHLVATPQSLGKVNSWRGSKNCVHNFNIKIVNRVNIDDGNWKIRIVSNKVVQNWTIFNVLDTTVWSPRTNNIGSKWSRSRRQFLQVWLYNGESQRVNFSWLPPDGTYRNNGPR